MEWLHPPTKSVREIPFVTKTQIDTGFIFTISEPPPSNGLTDAAGKSVPSAATGKDVMPPPAI